MFKHSVISINSLDYSTRTGVGFTHKELFEIADCDVPHPSDNSTGFGSSLEDATVFNRFLINMLKHFSLNYELLTLFLDSSSTLIR